MESQLTRSKQNMKDKIPEIKKALEIVDFIEKKRGKFRFFTTLNYTKKISWKLISCSQTRFMEGQKFKKTCKKCVCGLVLI